MTWFDQLEPADFAGHAFGVLNTQVAGGVITADEVQVNRGARVIALAPGVVTYSVDAYLVGADALTQVRALTARLDAGQGLLVHPHYGAHDVVARRWSVAFEARVINYAQVSIEFAQAAIEESEEQGTSEPADTIKLTQDFVSQAAAIVGEPQPLQELEAAGPGLGIDPPDDDATDEDREAYVAAAVGVILTQPWLALQTGTAAALGTLGRAVRAAASGNLDADTAQAALSALARSAVRTDSLALMALRESWAAFLAAGAVLSQTTEGRKRPLVAVARSEGIDYATLAARNRAAAAAWWAAGEVVL